MCRHYSLPPLSSYGLSALFPLPLNFGVCLLFDIVGVDIKVGIVGVDIKVGIVEVDIKVGIAVVGIVGVNVKVRIAVVGIVFIIDLYIIGLTCLAVNTLTLLRELPKQMQRAVHG